MNKENYPNWLVPLEIAQELKAIGFVVPCSFYYDEKLLKISPWHDEEFVVTNWNDKLFHYCVSIPTWEQVFEWFREKGYHGIIAVRYEDGDDQYSYCIEFLDERITDFNEANPLTYEEAREALVKALIQTYKNEQL